MSPAASTGHATFRGLAASLTSSATDGTTADGSIEALAAARGTRRLEALADLAAALGEQPVVVFDRRQPESYWDEFFVDLLVAGLPVTLTGRIIGKGVPGLVWSDDFVMQESTGIILLDYRQPFAVWDFLFGAFNARKFQGREVRVSGWYRRNPAPAFVIDRLEAEGLDTPVVCYGPQTRTWVGRLLLGAGLVATAVVAVLLVAG